MWFLARTFATIPRKALRPNAEVPDVEAFLNKIGRNMAQYKEHFETWEQLVGSSSAELKEKGIETRDRRYLLGWLDRYSRGVSPTYYPRGKKPWGGERKIRASRAAFYGRKHAEERKSNF